MLGFSSKLQKWRDVGVPPPTLPPTHPSTSSCAKALPHFASYIMEQRKFSLPPLSSFLYFLLHPLKAKRLFFRSFWRWYNFTWSLYNAHSQPPPHHSSFPYILLYSSPPTPFPFLIGRGHFMNSASHTFFSCFLLHPLFFLAKKILRSVNFWSQEQEVTACLVCFLKGGFLGGWGGCGRSRASGRSWRIQLSCGKEFWWEEDVGGIA